MAEVHRRDDQSLREKRALLVASNARIGVVVALDQAASSATNFAASIVGIALLTDAEYGSLSLALATYYFALSLTRAFALDPLLLRPADDEAAIGTARYLTTAASLLVSAVILAAGLPTSHASLFVLLALTFPLLAGVEYLRVHSFHQRKPLPALIVDSLWAAALGIGFVVVKVFDLHPDAIVVLALWVSPPALIGLWTYRKARRFTMVQSIPRDTASIGTDYAVALLMRIGALYLIVLLIGLRLGAEAVGYFGASRAMYGPVNSALGAFDSYFIPRFGDADSKPREVLRSAFRTAVLVTMGTLGLAALTRLEQVKDLVAQIGDSGPEISQLLWPMGLFVACQVLSHPARTVARRLYRQRWVSWAQTVNAVSFVLAAVLGMQQGELSSVVWFMAVAASIISGLWWGVAFLAARSPGLSASLLVREPL